MWTRCFSYYLHRRPTASIWSREFPSSKTAWPAPISDIRWHNISRLVWKRVPFSTIGEFFLSFITRDSLVFHTPEKNRKWWLLVSPLQGFFPPNFVFIFWKCHLTTLFFFSPLIWSSIIFTKDLFPLIIIRTTFNYLNKISFFILLRPFFVCVCLADRIAGQHKTK